MLMRVAILWAGLFLLVGCVSTAPSSPRQASGGMLDLAGEEEYPWAGWERRAPAQMAVNPDGDFVVFDAWLVEDKAFRDGFWDAAFHLLQAVQNGLDDGARRQDLQVLLMLLSAELKTTEMELAFLSRADGSAEGLVLRIVESEGSGIWLEAEREAGAATGPVRWTLRAEPGFEEAPGVTVWWERDEEGWDAIFAPGAGATVHEVEGFLNVQIAPFLERIEEVLWEEVTGRNHLEPSFERVEQKNEGELAPGWPAVLGLKIEERGLTDFVADSVFWPRTRDDALE